MNRWGNIFTLTTFGESHGPAIGGVIDGVPPGYCMDTGLIQEALDCRRPGNSPLASQRREADRVQLLSGLLEGKTLGTPIGFIIPNTDARHSDYDTLRDVYRPCHADYAWQMKYGLRDWRGGGRASGRETACRVVAGAVAAQILACHGIEAIAWTSAIGRVEWGGCCTDAANVYTTPVRCPDAGAAHAMAQEIISAGAAHDTVGGRVRCLIKGVPAGRGEPLAAKLQAMLASAMMSIGGAKGFEYGLGRYAATRRGTESADTFIPDGRGGVSLATNHSGGIQGGISNGMEVSLEVSFKPVPTLPRPTETVNHSGERCTVTPRGRHDPCLVPRAVPVVQAMANLVIMDAMLMHGAVHIQA